jgi:hypothetical protein
MSDVHHFSYSESRSHNFYSFSKDEAYRLASSPGLPLFGCIPPENYTLLDADEAMLERSICDAGVLFDDDIRLCECQRSWDVYDILESLLDAFVRVDMRTPRAFSQANVERVTMVTKRLRMLIQVLDHPGTKLFSGGKPMENFVRDCKTQVTKFTRWADILDRTPREDGSDQSLETFIRGPLSYYYGCLFQRDAGGNERGPFARFGVCFFEMLGYRVAPATIVRAVRKTPRSSKKRTL